MTVADLLALSKAAHADYRQAVQAGNPAAQRAAIQCAYDTRLQAHDADPEHTHPAWGGAMVQHVHTANGSQSVTISQANHDELHDALLSFYQSVLAR